MNALATFSKLMKEVFDQIDNVDNFLDELCSRLRSDGLTARPSKCFIGFRKVDYLG